MLCIDFLAKTIEKIQAKNFTRLINPHYLTIIEGIGPKIASLLNEEGILNLNQLSKTKLKNLQGILDKAGTRFRMHNPKTWQQQALSILENKKQFKNQEKKSLDF